MKRRRARDTNVKAAPPQEDKPPRKTAKEASASVRKAATCPLLSLLGVTLNLKVTAGNNGKGWLRHDCSAAVGGRGTGGPVRDRQHALQVSPAKPVPPGDGVATEAAVELFRSGESRSPCACGTAAGRESFRPPSARPRHPLEVEAETMPPMRRSVISSGAGEGNGHERATCWGYPGGTGPASGHRILASLACSAPGTRPGRTATWTSSWSWSPHHLVRPGGRPAVPGASRRGAPGGSGAATTDPAFRDDILGEALHVHRRWQLRIEHVLEAIGKLHATRRD